MEWKTRGNQVEKECEQLDNIIVVLVNCITSVKFKNL